MNFIPFGFILAGFIFAAVISEQSLRGIDEIQQGRLLAGTAALRKIHLVGISLVLLLSFFFPLLFWPGLTGYFTFATWLAANRIRTLQLSRRLQLMQIASVASIAAGTGLGWIAAAVAFPTGA